MSESQKRRNTSDGSGGGPRRTNRKSNSSPNSTGKKHKKRRKKRSVNGKIGKVALIVAVIIGFAVAGAALGTVFGILQSTEMLNTADVMPDSYTSVIYDDEGNAVDKLHGSENREYVKLSAITKNMQNAVVAIEDERFFDHNGIDPKGIMRAMVENVKTMEFSQGASTITQQVIKNEVLTNEKSL
ncbi:MAG: transglycosylase domain-containing protein, partial [Anaerotignum sp.]|nr:transglycosylase domain-containing protein [Anaerotignum sp.]